MAGDLYIPKNKSSEKMPAVAISGPFGAVKEQSSGLYAQTIAENGFVILAFDHSFPTQAKAKENPDNRLFRCKPGKFQ